MLLKIVKLIFTKGLDDNDIDVKVSSLNSQRKELVF